MLSFYRRIAQALSGVRVLLGLFAVAAAAGFIFVLLFSTAAVSEQWSLPLLVTLALLLCLLLTVYLFAGDVTPAGGRIRRFFHWLWQRILALILTAILLVWFFLFLKTLSAIIRQLFF